MIYTDCKRSLSRSNGFTLIELLVVVAVVGILAALILSAVQNARDASRKLQCENNLKQIGVALQNFQSEHGYFPAAMEGEHSPQGLREKYIFAPHVWLLPYLDQATVYNSLNVSFMDPLGDTPENDTARNTRIGLYLCPSETSPLMNAVPAPNSYRGDTGPSPYEWDNLSTSGYYPNGGGGPFPLLYHIGPNAFTDGLSNTVMMSEKLMGDDRESVFTPTRDFWTLGWPYSNPNFPPGNQVISMCEKLPSSDPPHVSKGGRTWYISGFDSTLYNHLVPPNWNGPGCKVDGSFPSPDLSSNHGGIFGASGGHPGGVNCLMGDGSVRFIKNAININTWRALSSRAGGEVIDQSF